MKTDYSAETENLINSLFKPSTPEEKNAIGLTLSEIHAQVTNVLPARWVYEDDVFEALTRLGFKHAANTQDVFSIKYYLIVLR